MLDHLLWLQNTPSKLHCTVQNEDSTDSTLVNFFHRQVMLLIYILTYYLVGQPIPFTLTASSPLQLTERVQFSSSPPESQGRVYPQGSSSNVLNCFLVLPSLPPGFTFWQVPSGDQLVCAPKACLRW